MKEAIHDAAGLLGRAKIEYLQDLRPKTVAHRILALGQVSDVIAVVAARFSMDADAYGGRGGIFRYTLCRTNGPDPAAWIDPNGGPDDIIV